MLLLVILLQKETVVKIHTLFYFCLRIGFS